MPKDVGVTNPLLGSGGLPSPGAPSTPTTLGSRPLLSDEGKRVMLKARQVSASWPDKRTYIFMYRCTSAGREDPSKTKLSTITFSVSLDLQ